MTLLFVPPALSHLTPKCRLCVPWDEGHPATSDASLDSDDGVQQDIPLNLLDELEP